MTFLALIGRGYTDTKDVPKGDGIYYRCASCTAMIPSVPADNIGCTCGNLFIDKDCLRFVVDNYGQLEVVRKTD